VRVAPIDHVRAKKNPWGLTPHQCCALRLMCKHGSTKQVWAETEIPTKSVQHHVEEARKRLGMRGHDVRLYLAWDRWLRTVAEPPRMDEKNL